MISLIAAVAKNNVIGKGLEIPWRLPEDQKLFKSLTVNNIVIMGRKTWESLGRPLKDRVNIVVSRTLQTVEGIEVVSSLDKALLLAARYEKEVYIIGGQKLYAEGLRFAKRICLSRVDLNPEGDVFFPVVDWSLYEKTKSEFYKGFEYQEWFRKQ